MIVSILSDDMTLDLIFGTYGGDPSLKSVLNISRLNASRCFRSRSS